MKSCRFDQEFCRTRSGAAEAKSSSERVVVQQKFPHRQRPPEDGHLAVLLAADYEHVDCSRLGPCRRLLAGVLVIGPATLHSGRTAGAGFVGTDLGTETVSTGTGTDRDA